jgi:hypothetical protein
VKVFVSAIHDVGSHATAGPRARSPERRERRRSPRQNRSRRERVGDHATNIAEDVIFIVEARDVRHRAIDRVN